MFACIFVPNFPSDRSSQHALLDCAYAFSPRVEDTAPGAVVFDVEGLERLFGSYDDIASKVSEEAKKFGWNVYVAIAPNPDAAVVMARGGGLPMEQLPIEILTPAEEVLETLDRWGIRTLGALAKLPMIQISERLGQYGVHLLKLARGVVVRPLAPHKDPLQFIETMELDYAIDAIEPLTFILARLLDQICLRLSTRSLATNKVHLTLSSTYERVLHLPLPMRNAKLLMKLLILDLEAHPPGISITSVKVEAIPVKPRVLQNGLFAPLSPEPEKLQLTLARIEAIVGEGNVGSVEILDTHRPDAFRISDPLRAFLDRFALSGSHSLRSWRTVPLLKGDSLPLEKGESRRRRQGVALRIFRPPLPFRGPILKASGPWHTSGEWWTTGRKWNREEWDVELADGLYRIYRDVETNRWFVEGVYD